MRPLCVGALLFSLVALLAGCQGVERGRVVRLANWGGAGDDSEFNRTVQATYAEFERQNPGVELQVEGIPGSQEYVTKLLLAFIAGTEPDVITLDASSAAVFIDNGVLRDLAPMAERDGFDWAQFYPNVVDIARRGERVYAVPIDFNPMVVYYDRRQFREAGVPEPQPGWTFEDFRAKAKALTRGDRFGFEFTNWMPGWIMWLWNNGGDVLAPDGQRATGAFDSPASIEAVDFLRTIVTVDRSSPSLSQAAGAGVDYFANGRAAMKLTGHWYMVTLRAAPGLDLADIGVVELPSNLPQSVTVMYQAGLAIGKNAKHPEDAWRFIKHMTSRDVQTMYQQSGVAICARRDVAEAIADTPLERSFFSVVPHARLPWGARVERYDEVERIGQETMDRVLNGGVTPADALRDAAREIDAALARR